MNVVIISEADLKGGGYTSIMTRFGTELVNVGHKVVYVGIGYEGKEHNFPYTMLPVMRNNFYNQCAAVVHNLSLDDDYRPDVILIGLDIPMQLTMAQTLDKSIGKCIAIFPVEAPPVVSSWVTGLSSFKDLFVMTKFGQQALQDAFLESKFISIPIDAEAWRTPSLEERQMIRKALNLAEDDKVVLTVAENQERKNLWATMKIVSLVKQAGVNIKHLLVTTRYASFGYSIDDLMLELKLFGVTMPFDRGIPFAKLWALYAASDAMLITSKAEGLGMPVLEAMAVGIPVVAPEHTAFLEHLSDGRGYLFANEYMHRDVYGNEERYFADVNDGAKALQDCLANGVSVPVARAKEYVNSRCWSQVIEMFNAAVA
jgi:glycosyltransferase involved in cell wall biosynthesis